MRTSREAYEFAPSRTFGVLLILLSLSVPATFYGLTWVFGGAFSAVDLVIVAYLTWVGFDGLFRILHAKGKMQFLSKEG